MARVLIITSGDSGRSRPLVGLAQWLHRAKHTVDWLGVGHAPAEVVRSGVEPLALPIEVAPKTIDPSERAAAIGNLEAIAAIERERLFGHFAERVNATRRLIREHNADLVVADDLAYSGCVAASLERVPFAIATASLAFAHSGDDEAAQLSRALETDRASALEPFSFTAEWRGLSLVSPVLNLIFAAAEWAGTALPANTFAVGPSAPPDGWNTDASFDFDPLDRGRPVLYATFGERLCWQPERLAMLARAAEPLGVTLAVHAGALAQSDVWVGLPGDVTAYRRVPQTELLERAAAFVFHGGPASMMEALAQGVPSVLVPLWPDALAQAAALKSSGAGVVLAKDADVEAWRIALTEVLAKTGEPRKNAVRLKQVYRAQDGARVAAEKIAAWIARPS